MQPLIFGYSCEDHFLDRFLFFPSPSPIRLLTLSTNAPRSLSRPPSPRSLVTTFLFSTGARLPFCVLILARSARRSCMAFVLVKLNVSLGYVALTHCGFEGSIANSGSS